MSLTLQRPDAGETPHPPAAPALPGRRRPLGDAAGGGGPAGGTPELVEIVTPRTNAAAFTPAENLFAAVSLPEPFSLEIAATRDARWFLVRTATAAMRAHLEEQLGVAYPQ